MPPHPDLRCLQIQLFLSLVLKELKSHKVYGYSALFSISFIKRNNFLEFPFASLGDVDLSARAYSLRQKEETSGITSSESTYM